MKNARGVGTPACSVDSRVDAGSVLRPIFNPDARPQHSAERTAIMQLREGRGLLSRTAPPTHTLAAIRQLTS
jgi:hypothetical protein